METGVIVVEISGNRLFKPNDVIVQINTTAITSTQQLAQFLQQPQENWHITFKRGGQLHRYQVRGG